MLICTLPFKPYPHTERMPSQRYTLFSIKEGVLPGQTVFKILSASDSKKRNMDTRKSTVSVFLILIYVQVAYSQEDPVIGTCGNTVMVMTKEEMKREISCLLYTSDAADE